MGVSVSLSERPPQRLWLCTGPPPTREGLQPNDLKRKHALLMLPKGVMDVSSSHLQQCGCLGDRMSQA